MHAGHLVIEGDPVSGLKWRPRGLGWKSKAEKALAAAREVTVVGSTEVGQPGPSGHPDAVQLAESGLVKLGWTRREAERRAEAAWRKCLARSEGREPVTAEALVLEALRP